MLPGPILLADESELVDRSIVIFSKKNDLQKNNLDVFKTPTRKLERPNYKLTNEQAKKDNQTSDLPEISRMKTFNTKQKYENTKKIEVEN
jgi:hypothetical protein